MLNKTSIFQDQIQFKFFQIERKNWRVRGVQSVCPDLAKFHHFGKIEKVFGNILGVILGLRIIGQIFKFLNDQILKK